MFDVYPPFTRNEIVLLSVRWDVSTRLGVSISEVPLDLSSRLSLNLLLVRSHQADIVP